MTLVFLWKLLFVIGVVLQAIAVNVTVSWANRTAWIVWAIAACIWLYVGG